MNNRKGAKGEVRHYKPVMGAALPGSCNSTLPWEPHREHRRMLREVGETREDASQSHVETEMVGQRGHGRFKGAKSWECVIPWGRSLVAVVAPVLLASLHSPCFLHRHVALWTPHAVD